MDHLYFLRIDGSSFLGHDMTYIRLAQDVIYGLSLLVLMRNVFAQGRSDGISMKTQVLYILAFTLQLSHHVPSYFIYYEPISALLFVAMSVFLVAFVLGIQDSSTDTKNDSFWFNPLIYSTNISALLFNYNHLTLTISIVLMAWSHYLKAVAMIPQLWLIANTKGEPARHLVIYVNCQGLCRVLDILHWIYIYNDVDALDRLAVMSDGVYLVVHCLYWIYMFQKNRKEDRNRSQKTPVQVVLNLDGNELK